MWEKKNAPLAGVASAVLFIVAAVVMNNTTFMPPAADVVSFYEQNSGQVMLAAYIGLLSAFFLVWFAASAGRAVQAVSTRLGTIVVAGGALAAVLSMVAFMAHSIGAERAVQQAPIDPGAAAATFDLAAAVNGTPFGMCLGLMIAAFAVAAGRAGIGGRWLVWLSAITAVALISPASYLFGGLGMLWIAIVGVVLYRRPVTEPGLA